MYYVSSQRIRSFRPPVVIYVSKFFIDFSLDLKKRKPTKTMKKSLTVLIIPDKAKKPYEFKLRHIFLWLMITILGFCSVLLGFGLYGIFEAVRLKDETAVLQREVSIFRSQEQKINELEQMLLRLKKNNEKLRSILGNDKVGMGGVYRSSYFPVFERLRWSHIESVPSIWPMNGAIVEQSTKFRGTIFISGVRGTPVAATANGSIRRINYDEKFGQQILIDHGNSLETYYGYLSHVFVSEGEWVIKGQNVGLSGEAGKSKLEGLRYAVIDGSSYRNPEDYSLW